MPYPRFPTGQKWVECNICGFDYPLNRLKKDSFGSRRCPKCWDHDGHEENLQYSNLSFEESDVIDREEDI